MIVRSFSLLLRHLLFTLCFSLLAMNGIKAQQDLSNKSSSQDEEKVKVGISGYIQGLVAIGQKNATSPVGTSTKEQDGMFMRMGIRRGYLTTKASYKALSAVTQLSVTDKSLGIFQAYLRYNPTMHPEHRLTFGLTTVPFGYELVISSRDLESFERAAYYSDLFPTIIDMGIYYHYSPSFSIQHAINFFTLDLGLLSGNSTFGMRKALPDIIGRIVFGHKDSKMKRLYGVSGYYGYTTAVGKQYARRIYLGTHLDYQLHLTDGDLKFRLETLGGWQSGTPQTNCAVGSSSPEKKGAEQFVLLERPFLGAMGMLVYKSKRLPIEGFVKYDYYNRNLNLKQRLASPSIHQDLHYKAEGVSHRGTIGLNSYFFKNRLRLSAHYELNAQEGGYYANPNDTLSPLQTFWIPQNDLFLLGAQIIF